MSDRGPGRPPFQPTEEQRRSVSIAAGAGMRQEDIALALGIDRKTLTKYFEVELSTGAYQRRVEVLEAMHSAAMKGNVTAQKAYLNLDPEPAAPGVDERPAKPEKLGKKEQAQADAKSAAAGTAWEDLLPRPAMMQ